MYPLNMILPKVLVLLCFFAAAQLKSVKQHDRIAELEAYIEEKKAEINPRYRLQHHVSPPVGWMNDPNGFVFYKGEYHLFYQFYPYDSQWGPMHWGHYVSENLVDWKYLPTALVPEEEMCFSGSAVVQNETLVLIYTGREDTDIEPFFFRDVQYLAFSDDGVTFNKYEGNPVLAGSPSGSPDFRDPKVWKHGDNWYMVIGSRIEARGQVLLYKSSDLYTWEFASVLVEGTRTETGYMYECPDLFELNGKTVILYSPQGMEPVGDRYQNLHQTGYVIGKLNYDTYEFVMEEDFQELDYGHDFYAAQTTDNEGRRFLVSWLGMWETAFPESVDGWAGAMTIIRELTLSGNRVLMSPVEAMTTLRQEVIKSGDLAENERINFEKTGELIVDGDLNQRIELELTGSEGGEQVWIKWDPQSRQVVVDRSGDVRKVEWSPISSESWRIFLDASSLELFCGEGEVVFSTKVFPIGNWRVTNLSPQTVKVEAFKLRRSVPAP